MSGEAAMPKRLPFLRPNPPRLSTLVDGLRAIEESGRFTNFGPVNTALEAEFDALFGTQGGCLTVCNATIGLMLALREAAGRRPGARYVLLPSFTFAATGQAAMWAGLTPVFCDIDPSTWLPCPRDEDRLIGELGDGLAVVLPYATFGNGLPLGRYEAMERAGLPVVIDAAASLGAIDDRGRPFGAAAPFPVVFSMHATKSFSVGEAGLIHCGNPLVIARLRSLTNYAFEGSRSAQALGLNAKLSEVMALLALTRLREFEPICAKRNALASSYRQLLTGWQCQAVVGRRAAYCFMAVSLPDDLAPARDEVLRQLEREGVEAGKYFSPHLAQQPLFAPSAAESRLPVTDALSSRIIALPLWDGMQTADVRRVCEALSGIRRRRRALPSEKAAAGSVEVAA